MSGSAERQVAARLLVRVEGGAFSTRLLGPRAGAGVRHRVLGVLRWLRALDATLAPHLRRPLAGLDAEVRAALRLGLHEAAVMGVPAAVATDAAVHLTRALGRSSAAGMVNAVLRRAVQAWPAVLAAGPPDLRLSHPEWLFRRWAGQLGQAAAEEVMAAGQEPAETWAWFYADDDRRRLTRDGLTLAPHPWCPRAYAAPGRARALLEAVARGEAYVQDPASMLVAHVAASLPGAGGRLADLCAAPGGKLALLLGLRPWRRVVGVDLHLGRVRLVRAPVAAAGGGVSLLCADSSRPPLEARAWDLVLLDAPCSGTGTLRRHPELRWRLAADAVARLARVQAGLLAAGVELLAPGGSLLYATCSIEPEENEGLVADLPAGTERVAVEPLLPAGVPCRPTTAGGVRVLPGRHWDGFTLHGLRRVE